MHNIWPVHAAPCCFAGFAFLRLQRARAGSGSDTLCSLDHGEARGRADDHRRRGRRAQPELRAHRSRPRSASSPRSVRLDARPACRRCRAKWTASTTSLGRRSAERFNLGSTASRGGRTLPKPCEQKLGRLTAFYFAQHAALPEELGRLAHALLQSARVAHGVLPPAGEASIKRG